MTTEDTVRAKEEARAQLESIQEMVAKLEDENIREEAEQEIHEDPLSVEVRTAWQPVNENLKASEYMILLCTGGPAVRMIGELSEHGEPETASLEYQDWFTPWEKLLLNTEEEKACLTYARQFYFGN